MAKLMVVAKREYMERVRSRWFWIITILIPVVMTGIIMIPMLIATRSAASARATNIVVLDATGTSLGERVAAQLVGDTSGRAANAPPLVPPSVQAVAPDRLRQAEERATAEVMQKGGPVGYLVLTDSTLAGQSARYSGRNASSLPEIEKLRNAVRQAVMVVRLEREGVRAETVEQLAHVSPRLNAERLDERGRGASQRAGLFLGIGVAILLFMSILLHGTNVMRSVLEEKTTRVAEVVLSSVKPDTLLAGKVLGVGAVGLTQQLLWIAISVYLVQMVGPLVLKSAGVPAGAASGGAAVGAGTVLTGATLGLIAAVILFFLAGFVFYATLYAAAGSMVNSEQEAQQALMPVMIPLMATWLLVNPILIAPNSTLAVVMSWLPFSSPIIMPMRMGLVPVPWTHVAGSLAVAVLGSLGAVWLAARIYRVGMLMYGKKPSFAEVARWIRYAG